MSSCQMDEMHINSESQAAATIIVESFGKCYKEKLELLPKKNIMYEF